MHLMSPTQDYIDRCQHAGSTRISRLLTTQKQLQVSQTAFPQGWGQMIHLTIMSATPSTSYPPICCSRQQEPTNQSRHNPTYARLMPSNISSSLCCRRHKTLALEKGGTLQVFELIPAFWSSGQPSCTPIIQFSLTFSPFRSGLSFLLLPWRMVKHEES